MCVKKINRGITVTVLSTFLFTSVIPDHLMSDPYKREAIFGLCRLQRIKKKTKALLKSIDEYKCGRLSIEQIAYQIASLKKTANKAFKKNIKVKKIMEIANRKIDEYIHSLMDDEFREVENKFKKKFFSKQKMSYNIALTDQYQSIKSFLDILEVYEKFEDHDVNFKSVFNSNEDILHLNENFNSIHTKSNNSPESQEPKSKIIFAYVSIFCGCLLAMIPTPFTRNAGFSLISGGFYVLGEDKWVEKDEGNKKNRERNK